MMPSEDNLQVKEYYHLEKEEEPLECYWGDCCKENPCLDPESVCAIHLVRIMGEKELSRTCVKKVLCGKTLSELGVIMSEVECDEKEVYSEIVALSDGSLNLKYISAALSTLLLIAS